MYIACEVPPLIFLIPLAAALKERQKRQWPWVAVPIQAPVRGGARPEVRATEEHCGRGLKSSGHTQREVNQAKVMHWLSSKSLSAQQCVMIRLREWLSASGVECAANENEAV